MFFKRKKLIEIDAKVDDLLRITAGQSKMEQDHWNSLEQNQQTIKLLLEQTQETLKESLEQNGQGVTEAIRQCWEFMQEMENSLQTHVDTNDTKRAHQIDALSQQIKKLENDTISGIGAAANRTEELQKLDKKEIIAHVVQLERCVSLISDLVRMQLLNNVMDDYDG